MFQGQKETQNLLELWYLIQRLEIGLLPFFPHAQNFTQIEDHMNNSICKTMFTKIIVINSPLELKFILLKIK